MQDHETFRRRPKQDRSVKRVEKVLAATRRLVGQRGNDAVSMREIATEAGVPVSSVYQYFPDKNALLRTLIVRYLDEIRGHIGTVLVGVRSLDDLIAAVGELIDVMWAMFQREPELAAIWSGIQANAVLREADLVDTREIAEAFTALTQALVPAADRRDIHDAALYIAHVAFFALRVAYHAPVEEAESLIREQKYLIALRLRALA